MEFATFQSKRFRGYKWASIALLLSSCGGGNTSVTQTEAINSNSTAGPSVSTPANSSQITTFVLRSGQKVTTQNVALYFRGDGNLMLYAFENGKWGSLLWASNTGSQDCTSCTAQFQSDGNLVLYHGDGSYYWASNTGGGGIAQLTTSNVVPYLTISRNGENLWQAVAPAPIAVDANLFTFANFQGGNILQSASHWTPNPDEASVIVRAAASFNLNIIRTPVVIIPDSNGTDAMDAEIVQLRSLLDSIDAQGIKAIIVLDNYTFYDRSCDWKQPFASIQGNARRLISALKSHPALFAWDLLNEPLWDAEAANCLHSQSDIDNVVRAVHTMYNIVKLVDPNTPTTVGEGQAKYMSYWNDVSSFASPHFYAPQVSINSQGLAQMRSAIQTAIDQLQAQVKSGIPMVIGEFGFPVPGWTSDDSKSSQAYDSYYQVLRGNNMGSLFWSLSTASDQMPFSLITTSGAPKPAATVVAQQRPQQPANARFVSQNVPSQMKAGQTYTVTITLQNTGTATWTWLSNYKLGVNDDMIFKTWNIGRILLSRTEAVPPGASHTFSFTVHAPSLPGHYHFQWQMVQEMQRWFGDMSPNTVIEVL